MLFCSLQAFFVKSILIIIEAGAFNRIIMVEVRATEYTIIIIKAASIRIIIRV
jgi:hypothetical protein